MAGLVGGITPSVLPDISPTRGEIDSWLAPHPNVDVGASGSAQPISPPVGEMPGRAEGGNAPTDLSISNPVQYLPLSKALFRDNLSGQRHVADTIDPCRRRNSGCVRV
jgi:hypothetical protein